ncbi:hypothetical protein EVAR_7958_1 [Eumeta japonica]|uniref:Uncharacterized protein n=1 Tax=Eumeta variegata TaxID=151549 RepID=A0A4C1TKA1_EUMVA|nr:hypothetical protein EVAR_7958_1 [Eumeta japonica]
MVSFIYFSLQLEDVLKDKTVSAEESYKLILACETYGRPFPLLSTRSSYLRYPPKRSATPLRLGVFMGGGDYLLLWWLAYSFCF